MNRCSNNGLIVTRIACKRRIRHGSLCVVAAAWSLLAAPAALRAQTSEFTYQGQLKQSGSPFNGSVNLVCTAWDAATDGNQIGATVSLPGTVVTNGLFTAPLDFGFDTFDGSERWLAISVNGTPLLPRQKLTAAPYALHAARPWVTSGSAISYAAGNVGIGVAAPGHTLDLAGDLHATGRIAFGNEAEFGVGTGPWADYSRVFDFSERITDFSATQYWTPWLSVTTVDPSIDLIGADTKRINHALIGSQIPNTNVQNISNIQGAELFARHGGSGQLDELIGGVADAWLEGVGGATTATGLFAGAFANPSASGTIQDARGIDVFSGNQSLTASITTNSGIRIQTPDATGPISDNYGLFIEDQAVGQTSSYAIYAAGGDSYLGGNLGIGTSAPAAPLDVAGVAKVDSLLIQTDAAVGKVLTSDADGYASWQNATGLTLPYAGSADTSGAAVAVTNQSIGVNSSAIAGHADAPTGFTYGGRFESESTSGTGILGRANAATGNTTGGFFQSFSPGGTGVTGACSAAAGINYGVYGQSNSLDGRGVYGLALGTTGQCYGVRGYSASTDGFGVQGTAAATTGPSKGVTGLNFSTTGVGVLGSAESTTGVNHGVLGQSLSSSGFGVTGTCSVGTSNAGVRGVTFAANGNGIIAEALSGGGAYALWAKSPQGTAVRCDGPLVVTGTKSFRIDHPFDPENKYLLHYCSESPEPLNVYTGNATTDAKGYAEVHLPSYFEEINRDFRYQLTVMDNGDDFVFAKVARGVLKNAFRIRTSKPGIAVSWMVIATRNDRYVRKYGAPVEVEKPAHERGLYQDPSLFNQPPEKGQSYQAAADIPVKKDAGSSSPDDAKIGGVTPPTDAGASAIADEVKP